ncbi:BSD domain-containing protein 1-like isoform X3 [Rhinatrema bivittatum]|uniref:BSD domain-containing protein 1-like isoform X3 n=1 Tax=Rhinatrema bivittatum TaxID=194408 RepID=UPI001128DC45|nr:BSD domain-containing protein 1-like isoform X3 [Rhinatrema bivittatum]
MSSACVYLVYIPLLAFSEDGGWWRSWLQQSYQNVREKSVEALEFIKRDLTEFSQVVQHDTASTIAATASVVKEKLATEGTAGTTEKVKKGLSDFLGVISDTFAPSPDKTIDCDVITLMGTPSGTTEPYDSTKARLYSLQSDPATYCNEPDGPLALFEAWLAQCNLEEKEGEISDLLVNSPSIRALYTKMVPAAVSHSEFWQRYFYKVHNLEQEEARRVALKQRAEQSVRLEDPSWEEEEEEFLGMTALSQLNLKHLPEKDLCAESQVKEQSSPSQSSDSTSPVTQIANPVAPTLATATGSQRLPEASAEDQQFVLKMAEAGHGQPDYQVSPLSSERLGVQEQSEAKAFSRTEALKLEGPTDLRVFELNSDSGKSTPSNNGKKGSSTDISEDWEKDFDLDMTEEEVQLVLSKVEVAGELEDEDWEDWE